MPRLLALRPALGRAIPEEEYLSCSSCISQSGRGDPLAPVGILIEPHLVNHSGNQKKSHIAVFIYFRSSPRQESLTVVLSLFL